MQRERERERERERKREKSDNINPKLTMRIVASVYIVKYRNLTRSCRCKQSFKALKYSAIKRLLFLDTTEDWKIFLRVKFRM